jgi:hypothetical protein
MKTFKKATKKPVSIFYFIFEGENDANEGLQKALEKINVNFNDHFIHDIEDKRLFVKTLEGTSYEVTTNDVIIQGIKGEFYPCKKDIFYATYNIE